MTNEVITAAAFAGLGYGAFEWLQQVSTAEQRSSLALRVKGLDLRSALNSWTIQCSTLMDRIFGSAHFSSRCFVRSVLISVFCFCLVLGVIASRQPRDLFNISIVGIISGVVGAGSINVLVDFLSLFETRYILRRAASRPSAARTTALLLVDLLLTFLIASVFLFVWDGLTVIPTGRFVIPQVINGALGRRRDLDFVIFAPGFLSTFSTSFWIVAYALSLAVLRLAWPVLIGLRFVKSLDLDGQPFRILGGVVALIIFALSVSVACVV